MPPTAPLLILKNPHAVLRASAAPLSLVDMTGEKVQDLITAMCETLRNTADGVGLAAPQVGRSLRLFIVSEEAEEIDKLERRREEHRKKTGGDGDDLAYEPRPWKYYVFINPTVKKTARRKIHAPEGCLSVPQKYGMVGRSEKITVEAYDEEGKKFTRGASRFFARVIQHELDHLDGTLFIDKVDEWLNIADKPDKRERKK